LLLERFFEGEICRTNVMDLAVVIRTSSGTDVAVDPTRLYLPSVSITAFRAATAGFENGSQIGAVNRV
jgi:hypothetical protein